MTVLEYDFGACGVCGGSGRFDDIECARCSGTGEVPTHAYAQVISLQDIAEALIVSLRDEDGPLERIENDLASLAGNVARVADALEGIHQVMRHMDRRGVKGR